MATHEDGGGADRPRDDYAVGYGRPPVAHRFRAGEPSRNPTDRRGKARPPSAPDAAPDFLDEEVTLNIEGRPVRMTRDAAIDHALFQQAVQGNVQASRRLDDRRAERERRLRAARSGLAEAVGTLNAEDEALIANALARRTRGPAPGDDPRDAGSDAAEEGADV